MRYVLGMDIGTTAIKGALYDENGKMCGSSTSEYDLLTPYGDVAEQRFEVYEEAFCNTIAKVLAETKVPETAVSCMGFSATGETVVVVDKKGKPLRNVIAWLDNRAFEEADYLNKKYDAEEIQKRTGWPAIHPGMPASKILWIKNHEPEIFREIGKVLSIKDYFIYLLTGRYLSEDSLMCDCMYWDMRTRTYWPEMLEELGLSKEQLPEILPPGTGIGKITEEAAAKYGLGREITINLGGMDQACGAIGAGNIRPGRLSESTGSALVALSMVNRFPAGADKNVPVFASALSGMYMLHTFSTGAIVMRWFRDEFCRLEKIVESETKINAYALMDQAVLSTPAGNDGMIMLPYLQGAGAPDIDEKATGVYMGITAATTKAHFIRAIMEGLALVLRRMAEGMEEAGVNVEEICSLGGGAKSDVWCRIKADVTGRTVKVVSDSECAPALGGAILAGVAEGIWPSVQEAVSQFVKFDKVYEPNPEYREIYDGMYKKFLRIQKSLKSI